MYIYKHMYIYILYIYIYIYVIMKAIPTMCHVPFRSLPQVHELPQSHCGDNREDTWPS